MGRLKIFKNEKPLIFSDANYAKHLSALDLNTFLLVDEFEIVSKDSKAFGVHIIFISSSLNRQLSSFPWWDFADRDLLTMRISDIPLGSISHPYIDGEQSWQIVIFEKRNYVYIIQGNDPCCVQFPTWYRVQKDRYLAEWEKLLSHVQSTHDIV